MGDWVIEKRQIRRDWAWLLDTFLGLLSQSTPDPARVTYTLRHAVSGETRRLTLAGGHEPDAIEKAIAEGRFDR